jgi:hypothetical protein
VSTHKDILNKIIPHFDKYPLITQKLIDYHIFKEILLKISRREHLTESGLQAIVNLRANLNRGLSPALLNAFPNTVITSRQKVSFKGIPDPFWLSVFISGEGCFYIKVTKSKTHLTGHQVLLKFSLAQHIRDSLLIKGLVQYWGFGIYNENFDKNPFSNFDVTKFKDIVKLIS